MIAFGITQHESDDVGMEKLHLDNVYTIIMQSKYLKGFLK